MSNGRPGAPPGNTNATKGRIWTQAIETCIAAWPEHPSYVDCSDLVRGMRKAAFVFVKKMLESQDQAFFREFGDRIQGKAQQMIEVAASESLGDLVKASLAKKSSGD